MWHTLETRGFHSNAAFALPTARAHYPPDRPLALEHVALDLEVDPRAARIGGAVSLRLRALQEVRRVVLDAAELDIEAVEDDAGHALAFAAQGRQLEIALRAALGPGERVTIRVRYSGAPRRGLYFVQPSAFAPDRPPEVWTQGQDDDSHYWFPCLDHPSQKATSALTVRVPPGNFALSNGELVEDTEDGAGRRLRYVHDTPHPCYLVTLVVGDYVAIEHRGGDRPITSYVHPHQREQAELTFSRTAEMLEHFEALLGIPYPYPRYSQIVVADFIFGGMENTTATSLTEHILFGPEQEADVRARAEGLVAHELAHQWWGDLVTCTDWAHGWLHEGFATYFEILWRAHVDGESAADYDRLILWRSYLAEPYRRALVTRSYEEPIELFDRHLYEKGALVLHLIRHTLGDEAFFRGLRAYAEACRGGNAESADLRRAIEAETGHNLEPLFDLWVHRPGHPELSVKGRFRSAKAAYELTIEQRQTGADVPEVYPLDFEVHLVFDDHRRPHRVRLDARRQTVLLAAPTRPRYLVFAPGAPIPAAIELDLPQVELRALVDDEEDVRVVIAAIEQLLRRSSPRNVALALEVLADHPDAAVRAETARALAHVPQDTVREALTDAVLQDGDSRVRRAAIRALGRFHEAAEPISEFLIRHMEIERSDYAIADSVRTLAELGTEAGRHFVHRALDARGHLHVIRAAAVEGLARLRTLDALPRIQDCTRPENHPRVREAATTALGALGRIAPDASLARTETRERLEALLTDPWLRVRIRAADGLARLGSPEAAPALARVAEAELDGRARRAMRLAELALARGRRDPERAEQLEAELRRLRHSHHGLEDRLAKLERRDATVRRSRSEAAPKPKKAKRKKKGK